MKTYRNIKAKDAIPELYAIVKNSRHITVQDLYRKTGISPDSIRRYIQGVPNLKQTRGEHGVIYYEVNE